MGISSSAGGGKERVEATLVLELDRSGHQHVIVALAPFDHEIAARETHANLAAAPAGARGAHRGRASGGAAGPGQARAALPGAHAKMLARDDRGKRDVGAL